MRAINQIKAALHEALLIGPENPGCINHGVVAASCGFAI